MNSRTVLLCYAIISGVLLTALLVPVSSEPVRQMRIDSLLIDSFKVSFGAFLGAFSVVLSKSN
jgi:uncharacterized YccA/Bax inhibitor family protein